MLFLFLGLGIGIAVLAAFNHASLFGVSCYYIGELTPATTCFSSNAYNGALGVAGALVVLGVVMTFKKKKNSDQPLR